jgi:hypothetical protein
MEDRMLKISKVEARLVACESCGAVIGCAFLMGNSRRLDWSLP